MKILGIVIALVSLVSPSAFAATDNYDAIHFELAPVISYQLLQRSFPYSHNEGLLAYGGRITLGSYRIAGELEVQTGSATETFEPQTEVDTSFLMVRVGARYIYPLLDFMHLLGRAGMEGYHFSDQQKINGTTTSSSPAWQYRPYVGVGVIFFILRDVSLSIEETYVVDVAWETGFGFRIFI